MKNYSPIIYLFVLISLGLYTSPVFAKTNELQVPFTLQAPYSQWGTQPWEDACEEAVTLMVDRYYRGIRDTHLSKSLATNLIQHIVNLENMHFGFNKDTNASQIVAIINNYFPWEAHVVSDPSIEMIEQEIDAGRPVIIPFWGRGVNNPYFRDGGPDYHTAVITGYDSEKQEFITHDPGIGVGLDYRYSYATLMDAMHDFLPQNNTKNGKKVVIFTRSTVFESADIDADNDGLSKAEELKHGTLLWIKDTDDDGYIDGDEVRNGFSPVINEVKLVSGSLIKSWNAPEVYLLESGKKHHIVNEQVFTKRGYKWENIRIVGPSFVKQLPTGTDIR